MLLLALNPYNPHGYYILLRWVVCGLFAYLTFQAIDQKRTEWAWTLGITAAVYNPFISMHFGREIWSVLNLLTVGTAVGSILKLKGKNKVSEDILLKVLARLLTRVTSRTPSVTPTSRRQCLLIDSGY